MSQQVDLGGAATGPLSGVRIIDFTAMYSGPIASSILGDQGAEVIKIESAAGDLMRGGLPKSGGLGSPFVTMNRNKKSLCLDLKTDAGRDIALKLIATADVVMENFRPGVMERLGLGYNDIREGRPKLVYTSITGVGTTGPYAQRRIYDGVIQAMSGFAALQSSERPEMVNSLVSDKVTSLTAAQAVVAALYQAERSGCGQKVELSMLDANLYFLWPDAMLNHTFLEDGTDTIEPLNHNVFLRRAKDGYIAVMPVAQAEVEAVCRALGIEHLLTDERFNSYEGRARHRTELYQLMDAAYDTFTIAELCERFEVEDVPYARINQREDVPEDPQVKAMQALWHYQHPHAGEVRTPRPPAQFSETPSNIHAHTPLLGEHNAEILESLGFDAAELERLTAEGVLFSG